MSWDRKARASKTRAAANISAMAEEQPLSPADPNSSAAPMLFLTFKRDTWNAYTPVPSLAASASDPPHPLSKSKPGQKRKHAPSPVNAGDEHAAKALKWSPVHQQCKVKLTRFHHGGSLRRAGGKYQGMITLETPCLRSTCANCWTYHPHLMPNNASPVEEYAKRHTASPITNDSNSGAPTPARHTSDRVDAVTSSPSVDEEGPKRKLTLKLRLNTPDPSSSTPSDGKCNTLLPNTVLKHISPTAASPTTLWRLEPRQRYTVRLNFPTPSGKARFKDLEHKQIRKELHVERLRLHQNKRDAVAKALRKPRRRHRVRLTFHR
ncbi:hypothetical protein N0V91_002122 [Didymella pomorum]|uniref:Uncharacterized protein n=1 Tax=Didymella pomorum TaxID=749634 RepID=A0A9W9DAC1_9PLEO|nr:hypothetical protein N0V91_002122 [Didymella pomorum]